MEWGKTYNVIRLFLRPARLHCCGTGTRGIHSLTRLTLVVSGPAYQNNQVRIELYHQHKGSDFLGLKGEHTRRGGRLTCTT